MARLAGQESRARCARSRRAPAASGSKRWPLGPPGRPALRDRPAAGAAADLHRCESSCRRAPGRAGPSSLRCRCRSSPMRRPGMPVGSASICSTAGTCPGARRHSSRSPFISRSPMTRRYVPSAESVFTAATFASPPSAFRTWVKHLLGLIGLARAQHGGAEHRRQESSEQRGSRASRFASNGLRENRREGGGLSTLPDLDECPTVIVVPSAGPVG